MANYSQAQVFPVLSYANTFSDWVVSTNGLLQQNNDLAANNFTKPSGTLFLGDGSLGLQVNTAAIVAGAFQVQGTGSTAYIQNQLRVGGLGYFTNTSTSIFANGQIQAYGSGTGLSVANNATISGTLTSGTSIVTGNETVSGTFTASANGTANNFAVTNYLNTNALSATGVSTLANAVITTSTTTTSSITNATVSNANVANATINVLVANNVNVPVTLNASSVIATGLSVTGQTYVNNITANGQFSVGGNFVINGTTVYNSNTFTLNAGSSTAANSYFNVNRGSSGTNASIRWNEGGKYFDILDVTSGSYYAITTTKTPSNITFTGTAGTSAVTNNGILTVTSNNGVVTSGTSNTFTISTPQDLRTSASPTFTGLTLSTALPIASGGTGATSAGGALTNILPSGTTAGYVLTTGGPGNFYWAAGGGGGSGATPGTTISSTYLSYSANGSGITYTTPTYVPGTDQLKVYIDGVRQFPGTYTETSNTLVSFSVSPPSGSNILVEVDGYINNPYYANNIAYTVNGNISSSANTIQLAIDGLTSKLVTYYANNTVQNPIDATQNTNIASAASYANSAFTQANGAFAAANTISTNFGTSSNVQFGSLGVGTAASGVSGEIRAANNITAYYSSDISLKENIQDIPNALNMVTTIGGKTFDWKDEVIEARGGEDGYFVRKQDFGVIAQDVQSVFPLAVRLRDDGILAVDYEKMCALAFAAIKELKAEIDMLKGNSK